MVLGQSLDLYWIDKELPGIEILGDIHSLKTGKLIGAACALGALTAGADERTVGRFRAFGQTLGLVFQIIDDAIDAQPGTGKSTGKDQKQNKLTYLKFHTSDAAREKAQDLTKSALLLIQNGKSDPSVLQNFAMSLVDRQA